MIDLLIGSIPPVGTLAPLLGPAMVTAAARKAGYSVKQFDFNIDFYERIRPESDLLEWLNTDSFEGNESALLDKYLEPAIHDWASQIALFQPRWIGISVFSYRSFYVLSKFLPEIRRTYPQAKIVIGGSGILNQSRVENLAKGLVDAVIFGEGENAIVDILKGKINTDANIFHRYKSIEKLDLLPMPDYSDLAVEKYGFLNVRSSIVKPLKRSYFFLEGSRGCVRKCNFCDIPFSIPGFRFRSDISILKEIKFLHENYNVEIIYFTDSLVNGSPVHLRKLCEGMIKFQMEIKKTILWMGYFIIRPRHLFTESDFQLVAKSGCLQLKLGVESGSYKVRLEMNKNIPEDDIDFTLLQCLKHGIGISALLMVGFPTETESDFKETLRFLERNQKALRTISSSITCSWRVSIFENTSELNKNYEKFGVKIDRFGEWYSESVNPAISAKRYFQVIDLAKRLNIRVIDKVSAVSIGQFLEKYRIGLADLANSEQELSKKYSP